MKKIIRVFPKRTSYTPIDKYALIGYPMFNDEQLIPPHDEIHISCVFTWDRDKCRKLQAAWTDQTNKPVLLGGPAFESPAKDFKQGMYLNQNMVFTSRGCNNNCSFCCVPKLEGKLKEISICEGNVIQDNNFLQCNKFHKENVFEMLKHQSQISFKGGLQADLIDDAFINNLQSIRLKELFIACDSDSGINRMKKAVEKLKRAGLRQRQINCYALIGDDMDKNEARLREIYNAGAIPRAQLFQPYEDEKKRYSKEWRLFEKQWQRPAATVSHMEKKNGLLGF